MKDVRFFESVYLHRESVDLRRGILGLCEIVQMANMGELKGRHLFVFCGKRRNTIKVIYFDKSGFAMWQKKLESEKFPWPRKFSEEVVTISSEKFAWLLEGYDVWKIKPFEEIKFEKVC